MNGIHQEKSQSIKVIIMFFTEINRMMTEGVDITLVIRKSGGQMIVSALPKANGLKDEAQNRIIPLTMTGAPEEMDDGFLDAVSKPLTKASGLLTNIAEFERQADAAAQNSKAVKEAKAAEAKAKKERKESYDRQIKKAEELIASKDYKAAMAVLQQAQKVASEAEQKALGEKMDKIMEDMNQGSLFGAEDASPSPAQEADHGLAPEETCEDDDDLPLD